jgi:predicted RND superfamily exporter protein
MNLMVFTMVVGVGVDYGVHILHRHSEKGLAGLETGLVQVSKGVGLAALTTLAGFGSLILSGYPGLQSMGTVALMGVGFSALIALTLVPALLQKGLPKKGLP